MTGLEAGLIAGAGVLAGIANTIGGGGSLLSYPVLLGVGLNPLAANVTNTVGLVPGLLTGAHGYRAELVGQGRRIARLLVPMAIGGLAGTVLLLRTSPGVFTRIIPWLIILGCLALLFQSLLARLIGAHAHDASPVFRGGLVLGGVYGAYFGAALGVMLLALLGLFIEDSLQRLNAAKVVCTTTVNAIAAIGFATIGPVHWMDALVLAAGADGGATVGIGLAVKLLVAP